MSDESNNFAPMLDRNLALEVVRVTEAAALAASVHMGRGDEKAADQAAVTAMHGALNSLAIEGHVVIGEGEAQKTPYLYGGEIVGTGGPKVTLALDALEGSNITAKGGQNALAVVAVGEEGAFLNVPDVYMDKIAVGPDLPAGLIDLDLGPEENLRRVAAAKNLPIDDLVVCILDRPRHNDLITAVRAAGARIMLIADGDISGVITAAQAQSGVDVYMGSGGAPEGILAAAALRCIGGQMQCRLQFRYDEERLQAAEYGITDLNKKYELDELARGEMMVAATGVTNGTMLLGVKPFAGGATTHSVVLRSKTGTIRWLESHHNFQRKTNEEN